MPSTYSPSLRLELIGPGEQAGTWNTTTNTNLGTLLDQAIAGYTTVSVTSANQAFTALDGAADESRNAVIELTTTTTAAFAVYAPPQEKTYIIYNNTAYVATVYNSTVLGNTTAAGTGVTVAAGSKLVLFTNGTNFLTLTVAAPGGNGDVVGPASATGNNLVAFDGTSGKLIKQAATVTIAQGGTGTTATAYCSLTSNVSGQLPVTNGGTGQTSLAAAGIITTAGGQTIGGALTVTGSISVNGTANFSGITNFTSLANFITSGGGASFGQATLNGNYAIYCQPNASGGIGGLVTQGTSSRLGHLALTEYTSVPMIGFFYGPLSGSVGVGSVSTNGTGTLYNVSSDYRLKENIVPLADAVARVKLLKPRDFTWKSAPEKGAVEGFIAHELQEVIPDAVHGVKDGMDADGKPAYQGVDASYLIPMLTAALQEALTRIEALEAKVGT
jgi:hypothetical protein